MNYADDDNSPAARRARLLEFAGERLAPLYPSWTMIMVGGLATDDAEDAAKLYPALFPTVAAARKALRDERRAHRHGETIPPMRAMMLQILRDGLVKCAADEEAGRAVSVGSEDAATAAAAGA
jgi:hypothetical protein